MFYDGMSRLCKRNGHQRGGEESLGAGQKGASYCATYLHPLVGLGCSDDVVSLVLAQGGTHPTDDLLVLLAVDAQWVKVLLAMVAGHLPEALHQVFHLLVDAQLLHLGEGLAAGAGLGLAILFLGHLSQALLAEGVPAFCRHRGLEEFEADGAAEVLVHALHEALLGD